MSIVFDSTPTVPKLSVPKTTGAGTPPLREQALREQALRLYRTAYLDRVLPELEHIVALIDKADAQGHRSTDIPRGDHGRNGRKYFHPERGQTVAGVLAETLPEAFEGRTLDILDAGCGFGDYMAVLRALGHNVVGTCGGGDYYIEHFRYVHQLLGLDVRYEDIISEWSFADASFDYVLSIQMVTLPSVILHTHRVIPQMQRACRRGGRVIVVPHCCYLMFAGEGVA